MATLTLDRVWVNRMDSGESVSAMSGVARSRQHDMAGEVRTYAGGRQRSVTTEGERGQFAFTLRLVSQDAIDTLREWKGLDVQVRDHRGQRFFGVYFAVNVIELREATLYDVAIELRTVTVVEGT
jgi:hypothetical protein